MRTVEMSKSPTEANILFSATSQNALSSKNIVPELISKRAQGLVSPHVYDILLYVNHDCRGRCSYCYEYPARDRRKYMTREVLRRTLQRLTPWLQSLKKVWVLGGEPFLHTGLKDLLDVFSEQKVSINVSTGLMYLDDGLVDEVMKKKNAELTVVLDYPFGKTRYDYNGEFFPYIDRAVSLLTHYQGRVQVGSVISPMAHNISGLRKWLVSNTGRLPDVSLFIESSGKDLMPVMNDVLRDCYEWILEHEQNGIPLYAPLRNLVNTFRPESNIDAVCSTWGKCSMLYVSIGIDSDGTLLACPSGNFAGEEEGIFGFESLDRIPTALKERRQRLHTECTECDYLPLCGGGCYKTFMPAYCEWQKFNASAALYFYLKKTRGAAKC